MRHIRLLQSALFSLTETSRNITLNFVTLPGSPQQTSRDLPLFIHIASRDVGWRSYKSTRHHVPTLSRHTETVISSTMDPLSAVEDLLGEVECWPTYVIYKMFVEELSPTSVKKIAAFMYGNSVPIEIAVQCLLLVMDCTILSCHKI